VPASLGGSVVTRFRGVGIATSLVLHGVVIAALLSAAYQPWWYAAYLARSQRVIHVACAPGAPSNDDSPEDAPEVRIISDPADVTAELVRQRLEDDARELSALSDEEQLDRLEHLSGRLRDVSSEQSVGQMAAAFQQMLGTESRAEQPIADAGDGEFDLDTAQFHDVTRSATPDGRWRYVSVLIDAHGRTLEVEMDAAEGKRVYETMQRIKANPLLGQVYRQIAMPLFDQLLGAMRQAAEAGAHLQQAADDTAEHTPARASPSHDSPPAADP
jgi:hypothetical protein